MDDTDGALSVLRQGSVVRYCGGDEQPRTILADDLGPMKGPGMHGYGAYRRGCRCAECRRANADRYKAARLERQSRLSAASVPHGRRSTYTNWDCRCELCSAVHAEACREYGVRTGRTKPGHQRRLRFPRVRIPNYLRWEVWERDDFTCQVCGVRQGLAVDHVIPVAQGGETSLANLQTLCKPCNSRKGAA